MIVTLSTEVVRSSWRTKDVATTTRAFTKAQNAEFVRRRLATFENMRGQGSTTVQVSKRVKNKLMSLFFEKGMDLT
jgi:hypothetical protein